MNLVKGTCTEELFVALNLPEILKEQPHKNPVGRNCVYDLYRHIVLIIYPTHHGYYPEEYRVFAINGKIMDISERWSGAQTFEGIVQLGVSGLTDDMSDEFLTSTLRKCYEVGEVLGERLFAIELVGRPSVPRSPLILIKFLNNLVLELEGDFDFAIQHFVPFCMMQREFDGLMKYLEKNMSTDLSAPAQQLLEDSIAYMRKR